MALDAQDKASHVLGWLSIGCWLLVYSPQIIGNYQLKSGEGLSIAFIVAWLIGDLCNLLGAIGAGLIPTAIVQALYYTLCDLILLFQIYYYRIFYDSLKRQCEREETTPLLSSKTDSNDSGPPKGGIAALLRCRRVKYSLSALFVVCFGVGAYFYDHRPENNPRGDDHPSRHNSFEWRSQLLGWTSAVFCLGSRIPQIAKNLRTKCKGLSLALFLFCIIGNAFFFLSLCVISLDWKYLLVNASWLACSGLGVFGDIYILYQFFRFRAEDSLAANSLTKPWASISIP